MGAEKKAVSLCLITAMLVLAPFTHLSSDDRRWMPLQIDGVHDPDSPVLSILQQPEEALSVLPPDRSGNLVDWVEALSSGAILPRSQIYPDTEVQVLDDDILFDQTAAMPMVLFPHRQHTEWLDCSNCHDRIFKRERALNEFGMYSILEGEYCGQCHGAVAFPLTECARCHSVARPAGAVQ